MSKRLTAIIQREGDGYVALCPELDVASQGDTIETARENLREALELFFECASAEELQQRMGGEIFLSEHCDRSSGNPGFLGPSLRREPAGATCPLDRWRSH